MSINHPLNIETQQAPAWTVLVLCSWNSISHPETGGTGPPGTSLMGLPGPSQAVQDERDAGAVGENLGSALSSACRWKLAGQLPAEACKCLQENRAGLNLNFMAQPPWK